MRARFQNIGEMKGREGGGVGRWWYGNASKARVIESEGLNLKEP